MGDSESSDSRGEKDSVDFRLVAIRESSLMAPLLCIIRIEDVEHLRDPAMSTRAVLSAAYPASGQCSQPSRPDARYLASYSPVRLF